MLWRSDSAQFHPVRPAILPFSERSLGPAGRLENPSFSVAPGGKLLTAGAEYLRALRALRLLRLLKLLRYGPAIGRFHRAFHIAKDELVLFGSAAMIVLFLSATGIYLFENEAQPEAFKSVFHALWWGIVTLTTVGYGDAYPVTVGGRIFTFFILIIGLGVVAIPTGLIASALSKARADEEKRGGMMARRGVIGLLAGAVPAMALGSCGSSSSASYRFRMTVEVEIRRD